MPSGKGVPQIMPAEILDTCPIWRLVPCLGIDLDNRLAVIGKKVGVVVTSHPLHNIHGSLIKRHGVVATVLVQIRPTKMLTLPADLTPLQAGRVGLPQSWCDQETCQCQLEEHYSVDSYYPL